MFDGQMGEIEGYMLSCMRDSSHDREHVYRVTRMCLRLADGYPDVDRDILTAAALLHDIGRDAQFRDPSVDHAAVGADMARDYLLSIGWTEARAGRVALCIRAHRWRGDGVHAAIEERLLYDSDKLDVTGAIGVARTILYDGFVCAPLYEPAELTDESYRAEESFLSEYRRKLCCVYDRFYTPEARAIARKRRVAMDAFYASFLRECRLEDCDDIGRADS